MESNKTIYDLQTQNVRRTYFFMAIFSAILFLIGYFLYGILIGA